MFRTGLRAAGRRPPGPATAGIFQTPRATSTALRQQQRRLASTEARRKGTWKGAAARWGVAAGAVYWYCTSPTFAGVEMQQQLQPVLPPPQFSDDDLPTVEAVIEKKRREAEARIAGKTATRAQGVSGNAPDAVPSGAAVGSINTIQSGEAPESRSTQEPDQEQGQEGEGQQAAFNPETGEINWDCPCLGGMAHGPCGEEFKAAFSCFVYSKEEPKGMDCIEKFQGMQDCFRKHPEVYGEEDMVERDEDEQGQGRGVGGEAPTQLQKDARTERSELRTEGKKEKDGLEGKEKDSKPIAQPSPSKQETPDPKPERTPKRVVPPPQPPTSSVTRHAFDATSQNDVEAKSRSEEK